LFLFRENKPYWYSQSCYEIGYLNVAQVGLELLMAPVLI
jgi:hypothetical protein